MYNKHAAAAVRCDVTSYARGPKGSHRTRGVTTLRTIHNTTRPRRYIISPAARTHYSRSLIFHGHTFDGLSLLLLLSRVYHNNGKKKSDRKQYIIIISIIYVTRKIKCCNRRKNVLKKSAPTCHISICEHTLRQAQLYLFFFFLQWQNVFFYDRMQSRVCLRHTLSHVTSSITDVVRFRVTFYFSVLIIH